jgi:hypothetical protein
VERKEKIVDIQINCLGESGVYMVEVLTRPTENAAIRMHRKLGPFEHLLWLVDQWTPRHFILVSRIEGSSISVKNLQAALSQCQRRHPILRATISGER